jgi:hypothetical protein
MKTFTTAISLLTTAALAAPTRRSEYDITLTLTNDFAGKSSTRSIASGNYPNSIPLNWGQDTTFLTDGSVKASSIILNDIAKSGKRVDCTVVSGTTSFPLNTEQNWLSLKSIAGANGLADLTASSATVACTVQGETISSRSAAAPAKRSEFDIKVKLTNDKTGASFAAAAPSGNFDNSVSGLFAGSELEVDGRIQASSAELKTVFIEGDRAINCQFKIGGAVVAFSNLATWVDLDGVPGAGLVDLTDAKLACLVEGEVISKN